MERLQKYLARSGVGSRRFCEQLIINGSIKVNNKTVTLLGTKVSPSDQVEVNGILVKPVEKKLYIMLNKPSGYVSTVKDDKGRKTVLDLIEDIGQRVYPVGRLDYDTEGLLLLTNDGKFAYILTHPKYKVRKVYLVKVKGIITDKNLKQLEEGVELEDGKTSPAKAELVKIDQSDNSSLIRLTIREGRNRQVRRMCSAIGFPVLKLERIQFGPIKLSDLPRGKYRKLSKIEITQLYQEAEQTPDL